jgi:hypothetical protein
MVRVGSIGVWAFMLCGTLAAQEVRRDVLFYPEKLHQDVDLLREVVLTCHPDPFRFTDSLTIVARFEALKDSIRVPMSVETFQERLTAVMRSIGDRNCQPQLPEHIRTDLYRHRAVLPTSSRRTLSRRWQYPHLPHAHDRAGPAVGLVPYVRSQERAYHPLRGPRWHHGRPGALRHYRRGDGTIAQACRRTVAALERIVGG